MCRYFNGSNASSPIRGRTRQKSIETNNQEETIPFELIWSQLLVALHNLKNIEFYYMWCIHIFINYIFFVIRAFSLLAAFCFYLCLVRIAILLMGNSYSYIFFLSMLPQFLFWTCIQFHCCVSELTCERERERDYRTTI